MSYTHNAPPLSLSRSPPLKAEHPHTVKLAASHRRVTLAVSIRPGCVSLRLDINAVQDKSILINHPINSKP